MDPLSALGVVAATVQFVDFSAKLLSRSFTVYTSKSGELEYDPERRVTITKTLRDLNERIKESSRDAIKAKGNDQAGSELLELCNGCNDVAQELLHALNKLHVNKGRRKEWESFRVALESIWSGDALDRLEQRLSTYRQQLSLHILWGMRKQLDDGLDKLQDEQKLTRDEISKLVAERREWKEAVTAAIRATPLPANKPGRERESRFVQLILRQLHFQKISNREERIPEAHRATFRWVFRSRRADQLPWADFGEWLESDSGIYWITGKPGAGKSTLMKFIGTYPTTTEMLRKPAKHRRLAIARFYFWNSGVKLQMTQEGLLRTLSHDILQQCPDLTIKLFPQQWEFFRLFGIFDLEPLDYVGLQRLLDQIIKVDPSTNFVFFIDGLDEFIGDHSNLAAYVKRLSESTNTKVCVSSRPWNEFEDAFASTPSLRVEDLTYPDVVRFIESNFNESPGYVELRAENEAEAEALLHAIAKKSSGVFLWVDFVVTSLLKGLTNGERLSKLKRHLDSLPPDLERLFQKMLEQIADEDREDASRLFQMVRAAIEPPTVIGLAWADDDDRDLPFARSIEPLPSSERDAKSRRMRRRLKSHCRGLLDADRSDLSGGTVEWIHRTVRDFLYRHEVWSTQQSYTPASFHPEEALCRSCLLQLKCADGNLGLVHSSIESALEADGPTYFSDMVSQFVWYTHKLYTETGDAQLQLYDELARTINVIFKEDQCGHNLRHCWCAGPDDHEDGAFLSLAIALRIIPYLDARLTGRTPHERSGRASYSMLQLALYSTDKFSEHWERALCYKDDEFQAVRLLLARGADPNLSTADSLSAWNSLIIREKVDAPPDIMMEFLRHGADPGVDLRFVRAWGPAWLDVLALQKEIRKARKKERPALLVRRLKFWGSKSAET